MTPACRMCGAPLDVTFVDLGMSPLCESYLRADQLDTMEPFYPLHVRTCARCLLVQLPAYVAPEDIFTEYAYFSSYSDSWVAHAAAYTEAASDRLGLGPGSYVVELASNDGYLLQHFVARGVRVLGVEPAKNVAMVAAEKGVPTRTEFFGAATADRMVAEDPPVDLLVANNVLAQVPDVNDFVAGMATLLGRDGVATVEFPHLRRLVEGHQFDTIYHEHFSYFSLLTAERLFESHGLRLFDVEELTTHGGSLRLWLCPDGSARATEPSVAHVRAEEEAAGYASLDGYRAFGPAVEATKHALLEFLIAARRAGQTVAGYGAPGKGNTLLNYCGIRTDLLAYTVDRNPYKQGLFLPGTHIPIYAPERLAETKPDYVLILPWNLKDEIMGQLAYVCGWRGQLVVPIPKVEVVA